MIIKIGFILLISFLGFRCFLTKSLVDISSFIAAAYLPVFLIFPNIYFTFFLFFRPIFDLAEKYNLIRINPNMYIAAFFILIYWLVILYKNNLKIILQNSFLKTFNILLGIFLAVCAIPTAAFGLFSFAMISDLARLISIGLLVNYAVIYTQQTNHSFNRFLNIILCSSLIPVSLGLYQVAAHKGMQIEGVNRIFGSFVHPNVFAQYLLVIFFLVAWMCFSQEKTAAKSFRLRTYFVLLIGLIFNTYTRNVWIALAVTFFIYSLFGKKLIDKFKRLFWWFAAGLFMIPFMYARIMDLIYPVSGTESSWQWRLKLWGKTFERIFENPFFGHGLGTFQERMSVMAHNDYLRLSYEVGFVGLFFYLLIISMILIISFNKARNLNIYLSERRKGLTVFCLFIAMLIISIADNLARSTVVLTYAFVIAAVFLAHNDQEKCQSIENFSL